MTERGVDIPEGSLNSAARSYVHQTQEILAVYGPGERELGRGVLGNVVAGSCQRAPQANEERCERDETQVVMEKLTS
jgi:hypothetical protein